MSIFDLFKKKETVEEKDIDEQLLDLKGVTPETLENLSDNKGDD